MAEPHYLRKNKFHGITTTVLVVVMLQFLLTTACNRDKKDIVEVAFDPETTYTMKATDVASLISDSGITRYRLNAKEWLVYSKAKEPFWYFPRGIYVEKFDTLFHTEASIQADTAYYFNKKELWHLIGNVEVENLEGKRFETSELFWDQPTAKVYSDKYIRIILSDGDTLQGRYGFEANQDMTNYRIFSSQAVFNVNETGQSDSTGVSVADTLTSGRH